MKGADALLVALRNGPTGFERLAKFILKMGGKSLLMVFIRMGLWWQEQEHNQVGTAPAPGASDRRLAGWHQSAASRQTVNPVPRLQKWLARAPTTAPEAGALPFN
ncbi:MAG: hypothetical protein DME24_24685 [Verrucomicrobia bacterium]|nr:MAG: hypothetical protein DME24_24685 [Verrucomicrobiota bacterium]